VPVRGTPTSKRSTADVALGALPPITLVVGKGGVGKTTCAAALALHASRNGKTLLVSTDPAQAIPLVLPEAPEGLIVEPLDAGARRDAFMEKWGGVIRMILDRGTYLDDADIGPLVDTALPGGDEIFAALRLAELFESTQYDRIVVDTAPTGHALRLFAMSDVVRDWAQALLRVLLKYRALVRPGQLAAELVDMSRSTRELRVVLRNRHDSRFIVVTRPAEVPGAETGRLLRRLRRLRLAVPAIVANALTLAPGRCPRCRATASAERRHLRALALSERGGRRVEGPVIIQTALSAPPPRGVRALEQWGARWIVNES